MNIENAQYIVDEFSGKNISIRVTLNGLVSFVPTSGDNYEENTDYQAVMEWVAEGNTIAPAD